MSIKRIIVIVLTIIALFPPVSSLISSVNEPQIQTNLQLYQTNLMLQASEVEAVESQNLKSGLLGKDPYLTAQEQYLESEKLAQKTLVNLTQNLNNIAKDEAQELFPLESSKSKELQDSIQQQQKFIDQVNLKLGIIQAKSGQVDKAITLWSQLLAQSSQGNIDPEIVSTARVLKGLWNQPSDILPESESILKQNLKGWFLYTTLSKVYQENQQQKNLLLIQAKEAEKAKQSLTKLVLLVGIPLVSGITGFILLIVILVQFLWNSKESILSQNSATPWETPWGWEGIWKVLIGGFFLFGQILLPVILSLSFSLLKINPQEFSLRGKAIYVLVTYLALAAGGITVIYFVIKPFFPLPKDWFSFRGKWISWGVGGYLVALPLVVIVSLINQQIWQGQGGSNPLLMLALESQDTVSLIIFFATAAIAAPLFEEVMFRGFLLPSLTRYLPVWGAIGVSSLIFAFAHLNLSEVVPLATLGTVLGVVYTRSRNLLSSMLVHSLWNSGTLLSLFILGNGIG